MQPIGKLSALAGAASVTLALASAGASASGTRSCGEIAFTQGTTLSSSNYGVGNISASNTRCATARTVAAAVKNRSALSYTAHGFRCTGRTTAAEPGAKKNWRCTRTKKIGKHKQPQTAVVTFFSIGV